MLPDSADASEKGDHEDYAADGDDERRAGRPALIGVEIEDAAVFVL